MAFIQTALLITVVAGAMFWFLGGGKIIRGIKLKAVLRDPLVSDAITSAHKRYRENSQLPDHVSFTEYAVVKTLTEQDRWAKAVYEQHPDHPVAAYFYAGFILQEVRSIRGTGLASGLTDEIKSTLRGKFAEAEKVIQQFAESKLAIADATLLMLEVYLQLGNRMAGKKMVEQNVFYLENRLDVVLKYLRAQYPRWGGSHEKLQQVAEEFSAHGGSLLAGKADAFCHLIEDKGIEAYQELLKGQPQQNWLKAYDTLPKAPLIIDNYEAYNLLLAHKVFAKYFLFINDMPNLKRAIVNTSGNFTITEPINPGARKEDSFYSMALELGVSRFSS